MKKEKKKDICISLNCYTISFRIKGNKDEVLTTDQVFINESFKDIMSSFVKYIDTETYINENEDRILYFDKIMTLNNDHFSGVIRKGHSGQESYIDEVNKKKAKTVSKIRSDQFNTMPFYFLIAPTKNNSKFIFLGQSYKQYGFKELFAEAFNNYTKSRLEGIVFEMRTLYAPSLYNKYINSGFFRKLRLRKNSLPKHYENLLEDNPTPRTHKEYEIEVSITPRGGTFSGFRKKLREIDEKSVSFIELLNIEGEEYDECLIDISINGRKRVLDVSDPKNFAASYDITNEVEINEETKHPNFDQIEEEAIDILNTELLPLL